MSDTHMNIYYYPDKKSMPKFFVVMAHDGEGNLREIKYVHEDAVKNLLMQLESSITDISQNYGLVGDTE